ncbi:MAG: BadF/BadG/BcrA/BcrD ATPase family protein [Bacteroidota bacterium]
MKPTQTLLIGIEGGGTKSTAMLSDRNGKILTTIKGTATNPNVSGFANAAKECFRLIAESCTKAQCDIKQISKIVIGTAGAGNKANQLRIKKILQEKFTEKKMRSKILITSDAHITLEGALGSESGIIVIAGTGSILLGKLHDSQTTNHEPRVTIHEPRIFRIGGWGRILGDDGSGFAIAKDALKSVLNSYERNKTTMLTKAVLQYFRLKNINDLPSKIALGKKDIAAFASVVIALATQHDFQSNFVLEFHCNALMQQLHAMMSNFPDDKKIPIVLSGGLLNNDNFYSQLVKKNIAQYFPNLTISEPKYSPAHGAILLALKNK